jgi:hypothetical protein
VSTPQRHLLHQYVSIKHAELHLDSSGQLEPMLVQKCLHHGDRAAPGRVYIPQGPELHLDFSEQKRPELTLDVSTLQAPWLLLNVLLLKVA